MANRTWTFEPTSTRRLRDSIAFKREARRFGYQRSRDTIAPQYNVDPATLPRTPTPFDNRDESDFLKEQAGRDDGGIFGTLSKFIGGGLDIAGDVRSVTRAPSRLAKSIVKPVDKLTGTKVVSTVVGELADPIGMIPTGKAIQAVRLQFKVAKEALKIGFEGLEWEAETLGRPIFRSVVTGIAAPMRMAKFGESFDEAVESAWKQTASKSEGGAQPDWFAELASNMMAPSGILSLGLPLAKIPGLSKLGFGAARAAGYEKAAEAAVRRFGVDLAPIMGAADDVALKAAPRGAKLTQAYILQVNESLITKASYGEAGRPNFIKRAIGILNPSVLLDNNVYVAHVARLGVKGADETVMHARYTPKIQNIIKLWDQERPTYIGPSSNPLIKVPQGKLRNLLENPDQYTGVSPRLRAAITDLGFVGDAHVEHARTARNIDILPFRPDKYDQGAIYVPTYGVKEPQAVVAAKIANEFDQLGKLGGAPGVTKPKWFQNATERMASDKDFVPETNLYRLFDVHNRALSNAAGAEAFKIAVGGRTTFQVKDIISPGTRVAKEAVAAKLANVEGRVAILMGKLKSAGASGEKWSTEVQRLKAKGDPIVARIAELGEDYGPELSYVSGEYHQLKIQIAAAQRTANAQLAKSAPMKSELGLLEKEVESLGTQLTKLTDSYKGIQIDPTKFVKSPFTKLWHSPKTTEDIHNVLQEGPIGFLGDLVDEFRLFVFAADFSPLTIQGSLGAAADPVNLARSSGAIIRALFKNLFREGGYDPWVPLTNADPDKMARFAGVMGRRIGAVGQRRLGEVAKEKAGLERLPLVGGLIQAGNNRMMNVVGILQYNGWSNDTEMVLRWTKGRTVHVADREAGHVWRQIIPELSIGERGVSVKRSKLERLPFISTSFIAAPAIFLKDVTTAFMHLGASTKLLPNQRWAALSGREQLSLMRFTNMVGTMMGLSAVTAQLSAKSRGWTWDEALQKVFDPTSPQFMSIILADKGQIGLGGPFRSFIKNTFGSKDTGGNWVPLAGIMPGVALAKGDFLPDFWRGKLNPPVGFIVDMIMNEDYRGREIRTEGAPLPTQLLESLWYASESSVPLSAGTASEMVRTGEGADPTSIGINVVAQIAGQNYREISEFDEVKMARDDLSHQKYGKNWEDLEPHQRSSLTEANPKRLDYDAKSERGMAYQSRSDLLETFAQSQVLLDDSLPAGPEWIEAHRRLNIMRAAAIEEWERANPEAAEEQDREPGSPGEEALGQYFDAFNDSKTAWGDLDLELLGIRLNNLESRWTAEQKAYIERNTGYKDTPLEKEYKQAQKVLRPYWNISDDVWLKLQERFPDRYAQYGDIDSYIKFQTDTLMRRGMSEEDAFNRVSSLPIIRSYNETVSKLRLKMRIRNSSVQAMLARWYNYDSPRTQARKYQPGSRPAFLRSSR